MMSNIFSIFDPSSSLNLSLNWISPMIIFLTTPFYTFWPSPSRFTLSWTSLMNFIFKEAKPLINYSYSNMIIFGGLFWAILLNNLTGLFPHLFLPTSHLSSCLSMSLTLWLAMILYSSVNYFNDLCTHLTPQGTPFILMPFMVIIESISLMIRPENPTHRQRKCSAPYTFSNRLYSFTFTFIGQAPPPPPPPPPQTLLLTLELSVSIIQAYVFSILMALYTTDT